MELHGQEDETRVVEDPQAANGRSVWMAAGQLGWLLQWPCVSNRFIEGFTYDVYVRARLDPSAGRGGAVSGGLYKRLTLGKGEMLGTFRETLTAGSDADPWRLVHVGSFALGSFYGYVYVRTHEAPLLIDSFVAVPKLTPGEVETYTEARRIQREEDERREQRLAAIHAQTPAHTQLAELFLFGAVLARPGFLYGAELTGVPWEWEFRQCVQDLTRHYCNFNYQLAVDANHPEMLPSARVLEEEGLYSVSGDVKVIPSIFLVDRKADEPGLARFFGERAPEFASCSRFLAWSLADEPVPSKLYDYIVAKGIIEAIDRQRPAIPILNTEEVIRLYGPYQQVLALDHYTIKRRSSSPWAVGDRVRFGREISDVPVWFMYGAYSSRGMRMPTRAETRLMIFQALLNGAGGLACYTYQSTPAFARRGHPECLVDALRTPTGVWEEIGTVGRKLLPVGGLIAGAEPLPDPPFSVDSPRIDTPEGKRPVFELTAWRRDSASLVLVVNNDPNQGRGCRLKAAEDVKEGHGVLNLFTVERSSHPARAGVSVDLAAGDALLFAVGESGALSALQGSVWQNRLDQEKRVAELDVGLLAVYGLDAAPFRQRLEAVRPGPVAEEAVAAVREDALQLLERKAVFRTRRTQLRRIRERLSRCERLLEQTHEAAGENGVPAGLVDEWRRVAKQFGGMRYGLLTGAPPTEQALQHVLASADTLQTTITASSANR